MHIKLGSLKGTRLKISFSTEDSLLGLQGFAGLKRISCPIRVYRTMTLQA